MNEKALTFTAFNGDELIARGALLDVALKLKDRLTKNRGMSFFVFDDRTCKTVEVDLRGTKDDLRNRLRDTEDNKESPSPGPGRPKLGVICREISLLPRHWDWLNLQPGGASSALRRLVEDAKKRNSPQDRIRMAQEVTYRFMHTMGGNLAGYEEALRSLYSRDRQKFKEHTATWPRDVRKHTWKIAESVFAD